MNCAHNTFEWEVDSGGCKSLEFRRGETDTATVLTRPSADLSIPLPFGLALQEGAAEVPGLKECELHFEGNETL